MIYKLLFLFIVGSTFGYILELFFRRFVSMKKWINPGFLVGPYLPLYGSGLLVLFLGTEILNKIPIETVILKQILIIAILTLFIVLLEFITGLIFIKGLRIKLWDYSNRKGNIMGIICPLFSIFWLALVAVYVLLAHNQIDKLLSNIDFNNTIIIFVMGIYYGIFIIDNIYSFNVAAKIKKIANQSGIIIKYENFKLKFMEKAKELKEKMRFSLPIKFNKNYKEKIEYYLESIKSKINKK